MGTTLGMWLDGPYHPDQSRKRGLWENQQVKGWSQEARQDGKRHARNSLKSEAEDAVKYGIESQMGGWPRGQRKDLHLRNIETGSSLSSPEL